MFREICPKENKVDLKIAFGVIGRMAISQKRSNMVIYGLFTSSVNPEAWK